MSEERECDEYGFGTDGIHVDTGTVYDGNGFDRDGVHRETGDYFSPTTRRTREGERYDDEGFNWAGRDREGYDRDGYDSDGYNEDGEDSWGNTRCENGDCDSDCDCRRESVVGGYINGYETDVLEETDWKEDFRVPVYCGHEIEMLSRDDDTDDVDTVLSDINVRYAKCKPTACFAAIAKSDSSLDRYGPGGFECVTVPLSEEQTYAIFSKIRVLGDGNCKAFTCGESIGHHIHVGRRSITPLTLGKLGVFMNQPSNHKFLELVAQRAQHYNSFEVGKKIAGRRNRERHSVLNVTEYTVEFRLFRANLLGTAILKNYEFVRSALAFCDQAPCRDDELTDAKYLSWLADNHHQYKYLCQWLCSHARLQQFCELVKPAKVKAVAYAGE
jgi:hypothetical protein